MDNDTNPELKQLMSDINRASEIIGIQCQEEVIWRILQTYEEQFLKNPVGLRVTSKEVQELNIRYVTMTPHFNPYAVALENGYLKKTDHPVYDLAEDLLTKHPENGYFIDLGATCGFEKLWGIFADPFTLDYICAMDTMPPSIKHNKAWCKSHELDWINLIGINFIHGTVNLYWSQGSFPNSPEIAEQTVMDAGFSRPPEADSLLNSKAFTIYATFSWESEYIERLSYACGGPLALLPQDWSPILNKFAAEVPLRGGDLRTGTINTCYGRNIPNYYKLEADYRNTISEAIQPTLEKTAMVAQAAQGRNA